MFRYKLRTLLIVLALVALAVFLWNPFYWLTYAGEIMGRASGRITVP